MASPQIVLTTSLAAVAVVYAFWCDIRMANKSRKIRARIEQEAPGPWSGVNPFARNWNGGQPGIKLLHRRGLVHYPGFEEEVQQLRDLERRMLLGIGLGTVCLGLVAAGTRFWSWQW